MTTSKTEGHEGLAQEMIDVCCSLLKQDRRDLVQQILELQEKYFADETSRREHIWLLLDQSKKQSEVSSK